jgi:hypothetical protein
MLTLHDLCEWLNGHGQLWMHCPYMRMAGMDKLWDMDAWA